MKKPDANSSPIAKWILGFTGYQAERSCVSGRKHGFREDDASRTAIVQEVASSGHGPETPVFIGVDGSGLGATDIGSFQYFTATEMAGTAPDHLSAQSGRKTDGLRGLLLLGLFARKPMHLYG